MCSLHFRSSDYQKESKDKDDWRRNKRPQTGLLQKTLEKWAVPSVFPNLPSYLSRRLPEPRASTSSAESRREKDAERQAEKERQELERDKITSFDELKKRTKDIDLPDNVHVVPRADSVLFISFKDSTDSDPMKIQYYLEIASTLDYSMAIGSCKVSQRRLCHINSGDKVKTFSAVSGILSFLQETEETKGRTFLQTIADTLQEQAEKEDHTIRRKLLFLAEQLFLASCQKKGRKYSSDLLTAAVMWKTTSTALYTQLLREECLTLPSISLLTKLSKSVTTDTGISPASTGYLSARFNKLSERERYVVLMLDEIYCAERAEYASGRFFGSSGEMCKTVLCFMVKSIGGSYSDVVALFPVRNLDAKRIHQEFEGVMKELTSIGYQVIAVSVDNAAPNRKFYVEELCLGNLKTKVTHPEKQDQEIYLLFDAVHNFKNVYNNFQTRKEFIYPALVDTGEKKASFLHLEQLYNLELGKPIKMAYKLSDKVLHPTNIEKTNVLLADSLFHESTIAALRYYTEEFPDWRYTADFLQVVRNWWNILNVKSVFLGTRKRNKFMNPVSKEDKSNLATLELFGKWLKRWRENARLTGGKRCLTEETFLATIQTSFATVEAASLLLEKEEFSYVLLGHLQSDPIEKRFGWYRQLAGANYFVSLRPILEAEKLIRLKSLVKYSGLTMTEVKDTFEQVSQEKKEEVIKESFRLTEIIQHDVTDVSGIPEEDANIVFYVAGCFARSLCKEQKCQECVVLLKKGDDTPTLASEKSLTPEMQEESQKFLEQVNRGGLCYPSDLVFVTCLHVWKYYHDIQRQKEAFEYFFSTRESQQVFLESFLITCKEKEELSALMNQKCANDHQFGKHFKRLVLKMFNTFSKNMCSEKNSAIHLGKKRTNCAQGSDAKKIKKLQSQ